MNVAREIKASFATAYNINNIHSMSFPSFFRNGLQLKPKIPTIKKPSLKGDIDRQIGICKRAEIRIRTIPLFQLILNLAHG